MRSFSDTSLCWRLHCRWAMRGNDGSVILRICEEARRVKALSVMCHSYLNGYIDAHPDSLHQPVGAVLQQLLSEPFLCAGKK